MQQGQGNGMAAMPAAPPVAPASQNVMQNVRMVEQLAEALTGSAATQDERNAARTQLNEMGTNVSHIPLIRAVLDHSTNSSAQQVACNSLTRLVDDYWTSYSVQQRIELSECTRFALRKLGQQIGCLLSRTTPCTYVRYANFISGVTRASSHAGNYILSFLANKGPSLQLHVITAMIQLLCRITKLGWFDEGHGHRKLVDEVKKFLEVRPVQLFHRKDSAFLQKASRPLETPRGSVHCAPFCSQTSFYRQLCCTALLACVF
jgi:hypothetical protein